MQFMKKVIYTKLSRHQYSRCTVFIKIMIIRCVWNYTLRLLNHDDSSTVIFQKCKCVPFTWTMTTFAVDVIIWCQNMKPVAKLVKCLYCTHQCVLCDMTAWVEHPCLFVIIGLHSSRSFIILSVLHLIGILPNLTIFTSCTLMVQKCTISHCFSNQILCDNSHVYKLPTNVKIDWLHSWSCPSWLHKYDFYINAFKKKKKKKIDFIMWNTFIDGAILMSELIYIFEYNKETPA